MAGENNPDKILSVAIAYLTGMDPDTRQVGSSYPIKINSPLLFAGSDFTETTMSGNATLTVASKEHQRFNVNGANRTATLPAVALADGKRFIVKNTGTAFLLTVQTATPTTVRVLGPGDVVMVVCDGANWRELMYIPADIDRRAGPVTMSGNATLTAASDRMIRYNPNSSDRTVTLPAEADSDGLWYWIAHVGSTNRITVQDDTPTTIYTLRPGEGALYACDGSAWLQYILTGPYTSVLLTTMAADMVLTPSSRKIHRVNPDGTNRNIDLPVVADCDGLAFQIMHSGTANTVTVRLSGAGATVLVLSPGDEATFVSDGVSWYPQIQGSSSLILDAGRVAEARCIFTAQPVDGNTLTIGADVYEFDDNASVTGGRIAVTIAGSAALTLANLVTAINASGTESVVGDAVGTDLRVRSADRRGGQAIGASPSIVLAENITDAADVWRCGNVNMNTLGGAARGLKRSARGSLTVTSAMITNEPFTVASFPFTPTGFHVEIYSATGLFKGTVTDLFTIANQTIQCNVDGATHVANTDVIQYHAWE